MYSGKCVWKRDWDSMDLYLIDALSLVFLLLYVISEILLLYVQEHIIHALNNTERHTNEGKKGLYF